MNDTEHALTENGEPARRALGEGRRVPSVIEAPGDATAWVFDTVHSSVSFSVRRWVVGRVRGQFTKWRGSITYRETAPADSSVRVSIDAGSIDTGDVARDAHLRSADFLDVKNFPLITFTSTLVRRLDSARLAVEGVLSIRGFSREVVLDCVLRGKAKDRWGNERLGFGASTVLPRHAFGLVWNEILPTGEVFVGEEVEVSIDIEAMRSPPARA